MRTKNWNDEEQIKQCIDNETYAESLRFLHANPFRCEQCGWPISYKGTCAACIEDDSIFCNTTKEEE